MGDEKFSGVVLTQEQWAEVHNLSPSYRQWRALGTAASCLRTPVHVAYLYRYPDTPHYARILHEFMLWRATQRLLGEEP
jgi:hypothetical protein